jgi:thiamine-phosphate pyrophosphorylase
MPEPAVRLHLVTPPTGGSTVALCFSAACEAGDVASVLAAPDIVPALIELAHKHDVALLTTEPEAVRRLGCDGIEVGSRQDYDAAREILGYNHIVGAHCGSSRHLAMDLADAGADYIAFSQIQDFSGAEPIIGWWSGLFEIPCISADPVEVSGIAAILSQRPDFIRPPDKMWQSADDSRAVISSTMKAIVEWGS